MVVYGLYILFNHKWQNRMLLIASYFFYGAWDWRFLLLIIISTVLDFTCGLRIFQAKEDRRKRRFLYLSIFGNLSILGLFKYFDFFTSSFQVLISHFGINIQPHFLEIILPVGISFYTFQTMSYTIDIYREEMEPTRRFLDFALFVAFFPQLVAGPIERAKNLLPQMLLPRKLSVNTFFEGCYLIYWGLFQKVFIADNLARIVDPVFTSKPPYQGAVVLLATYAFAFQIFCDFAGYSNIARGVSKCMGFNIMINFNLPYFSRNPMEFWRRWHISLSTWLRDYLYIPLGGNRLGNLRTFKNLMVTMLLGGLWHGAAWTYVIWGAYHGLLLSVHRVIKMLHKKINISLDDTIKKNLFGVRIFLFFNLVSLGWLLFRSQSITQFLEMFQAIIYNFNIIPGIGLRSIGLNLIFYLSILLVIQTIQYLKSDLLIVLKWSMPIKATVHSVMFYLLVIYNSPGYKFIYFQF